MSAVAADVLRTSGSSEVAATPPSRFSPRGLLAAFAVTAIVGYALYTSALPMLFNPWYFNTEEFPYAQEIIRFAELDFRQEFFDIPGTPLLMLGTVLWWPFYLFSLIAGDASASQGIRFFTFAHLQELYVLLRIISCCFFALSICLAYAVGRRLTNRVGGYVAAFVLAAHPIFGDTVSHLRIEPTATCAVLAALWFMIRGIDTGSYRSFFVAGMLAGVTGALRFPALTAALPVLILYCLLFPVYFADPRSVKWNWRMLACAAAIIFTGGLLCVMLKLGVIGRHRITDYFLLTSRGVDYPLATNLTQKLWLGMSACAGVGGLALLIPRVRRLAHSQLVPVIFGAGVGFVLGVPTIFRSSGFFLRSLNMFIDRNQVGQDGLQTIGDVVMYYLFGAQFLPQSFLIQNQPALLCTLTHIVLLGLAVVCIVVLRNRKWMLPILAALVFGILSQYGKLQTTRHICTWLPFFAILLAYPVAMLAECRPLRSRRGLTLVYCTGITLAIGLYEPTRLSQLAGVIRHFAEKIELMPAMEAWVAANTTKDDKVFLVCSEPMNSECILTWMEMNGLKVPDGIRANGKKFVPWFGDIQPLRLAGKGHIVISRNTYKGFYIDYYSKVSPEKLTNPYTDPQFKLEKTIDPGLTTIWLVYSFDFTAEGDLDPPRLLAADVLGTPVYLTELRETKVQCYIDDNWGFGKNGSNGSKDGRIMVHGKLSFKGLGTHALAEKDTVICYELDKPFHVLQGGVALNDSSPGRLTPVTFRVESDGRCLWESKPIQKAGVPQFFEVDTRGVHNLELRVSCPGNNHGAHAVWINPRLFPGVTED